MQSLVDFETEMVKFSMQPNFIDSRPDFNVVRNTLAGQMLYHTILSGYLVITNNEDDFSPGASLAIVPVLFILMSWPKFIETNGEFNYFLQFYKSLVDWAALYYFMVDIEVVVLW